MKFVKWLIGLIVVLAIVVFGGGYLLPKDIKVARSIEIAAPAEKVFPYVASLKRFNEWSPWAAMDPEMKPVFEGTEAAIGEKLKWTSKVLGDGSQTTIALEPNKSVTTELDLGMGKNFAKFALEPSGAGTRVTWDLATTLDRLLDRWFGLMLDRWVGPDFEKGLASLKSKAESNP